jgi:hypothetical protein
LNVSGGGGAGGWTDYVRQVAHIGCGWGCLGSRGPFAVESRPRRKRYFLCAGGFSRVRIQCAAIDWAKTAEVNGVTVPGLVLMNRIGPVLQPRLV